MRCLRQVAERLRDLPRPTAIRWRGSAATNSPSCSSAANCEPTAVAALASQIVEIVAAPYEIDGHQLVIGVSIGIALAPDDGDNPDELLKNADLALYRAKADGRGTYRFFEAGMDARVQAAPPAGARPARRARRERIRALLPADPRSRHRRDRRLRGAGALASSASAA